MEHELRVEAEILHESKRCRIIRPKFAKFLANLEEVMEPEQAKEEKN